MWNPEERRGLTWIAIIVVVLMTTTLATLFVGISRSRQAAPVIALHRASLALGSLVGSVTHATGGQDLNTPFKVDIEGLGSLSNHWHKEGLDGRFEFHGLPAGEQFDVVIRAEDFETARATHRVRVGETLDLGFIALRPMVHVAGGVLDQHGRPCPGATVTASSFDRSSTAEAIADARGKIRLGPLLPGHWEFSVSSGDASLPHRLAADFSAGGRWNGVRFEVHSDGASTVVPFRNDGQIVTGTLREREGDPLRSIWIQSRSADGSVWSHTLTADDGTFALAAPANAGALIVCEPGWVPRQIPLSADAPLDVELRPGGRLSIALVDEQDAPVTGARIAVRDPGPAVAIDPHAPEIEPGWLVRTTDAAGRATFASLTPGLLGQWTVTTPGLRVTRPWTAEVSTQAAAEVELRAERPRSWRATVLDLSANPVEGAELTLVWLEQHQLELPEAMVTDATGSVRFADLPPPPWRVVVKREGFHPLVVFVESDATVPESLSLTPERR